MTRFLHEAVQSMLLFGQEALSGGNIWILMFAVAIAIGIIAFVRGKLTDGWIWVPVLALVMWYAMYRWLRLRA